MKSSRHIAYVAVALVITCGILLVVVGLPPRMQAGFVVLFAGACAAHYLALRRIAERSLPDGRDGTPEPPEPSAAAESSPHADERGMGTPTPQPEETANAGEPLPPRVVELDGPSPRLAAPAENPAPDTAPVPAQPRALAPASSLDFDALSDRLSDSGDPLDELRLLVGDIRTREADGPQSASYPSGLERFAAQMLVEAGLLDHEDESPRISYVRLQTSGLCYLRTHTQALSHGARLRLLRIEAALNAVLFCQLRADDPASLSLEDCHRLYQAVYQRFVAQAEGLDLGTPLDETDDVDGEWSVRRGISHAIETLQLPQRLTANFRTNVRDGNVAFEVDLPPASLFPASAYVEGLGIVKTTGDMRQRAFGDYALRLALLLAASAFACSERVRHVWVAGIIDGPRHRTCYLSVDFDRWRFSQLDLGRLGDLDAIYRGFAAVLRHDDGWLRPVAQGFSLEEERFCPLRRYIPVSLSSQRLSGHLAQALGTDHVSGLAIEEADNRAAVAAMLMMHMVPETDPSSTERNVHTVIEMAADDPDPTVRLAAERVVGKLIDGSLAQDPLAIGEEFVNGDPLTRAVMRAQELMASQRWGETSTLLSRALAATDGDGTYADTSSIVYRFFATYVERTLYNRLRADERDGRALLLVPNSYYAAHLLLSMALLAQGEAARAIEHARRLVDVAPLDARARLNLVRCLEADDRAEEAEQQLRELLELSHEPDGLGAGYYRMAYFQWQRGNLLASQACYRRAMQLSPLTIPMAAMELSVMSMQHPGTVREEMSDAEIREAMVAHDIPLAPTERVSKVFYDCARAALDAEVFPVARNFVQVMGSMTRDDEIMGVLRSLEAAPDR